MQSTGPENIVFVNISPVQFIVNISPDNLFFNKFLNSFRDKFVYLSKVYSYISTLRVVISGFIQNKREGKYKPEQACTT